MTAVELIERLKSLPPESTVLVEGYETGYDDIVDLKTLDVVRYRKAQEWDGEYSAVDKFTGDRDKTIPVTVILGRRGNLR
ncbi:hypothetical protein [Marinobacter sp. HL-58]|uniref:hypothetical protein n=1 Tax=Marinobacter sp. HL-58 TaxID=1479237 RepID=UPI0004899CC2|nr:hypothetical protein [Marinobacter sp. HL-58]KPP97214.1 MAG: hypothetical protein HLUCCO03_09510 [Marinobacter sp. HL-58]